MPAALRFWLLPTVLGLDAPVVAVLWQELLARDGGVSLALSGRISLFLAVWAVYLADRLLDARTTTPGPGREAARHLFTRRHRRALLVLLAAVVVAGFLSVSSLRPAVIADGLALAAAVLLYLILVHRTGLGRVPKEALVALLFASGTALAPWVRANSAAGRRAVMLAAASMALACLLNTVLIEVGEWKLLRSQAPPRPAWLTLRVFDRFQAAAGLVTVAGLLAAPFQVTGLATALSAALLCWLWRRRTMLGPEPVRVLADCALAVSAIACLMWPSVPISGSR